MLITAELLEQHGVCAEQVAAVRLLWPNGAEPTVEVLAEAAAEGLDPWWLWHLLPAEGPGSRRAYALWCAEQVAHLSGDARVGDCLAVVRRRVNDPGSVSNADLDAARDAARAAAWDAAWDAARAAAWDAARDAARAAARAAARDAAWDAARAAARDAAWDAAGAAARAAAGAAARAAARAAAGDAARAAQRAKLSEMVDAAFAGQPAEWSEHDAK